MASETQRFRVVLQAAGLNANGDFFTEEALQKIAADLKRKCPYPALELANRERVWDPSERPVRGTVQDAFVTERGVEVLVDVSVRT